MSKMIKEYLQRAASKDYQKALEKRKKELEKEREEIERFNKEKEEK